VALGGVAWFLARESKSLLIGEGVTLAEDARIREIVKANADVVDIVHLRTMHLGPDDVIMAIKVRFLASLTVATLEQRINEIESRLRQELPKLRRIYVEPGFDERALRGEAV
jgi:divalent metal cation (Fe/Co/Zn/Cd) transporter